MADRILFGKSQLPLFATPTAVAGYTRNGKTVAGYTGRRRHAAPAAPTAKPQHLEGDALVQAALQHLSSKLRTPGAAMEDPTATCNYIRLHLGDTKHEVFGALFLDSQNCLIEGVKLAHGTIDSAAVYPRRVVEEALKRNAAAVIFFHNHPSGHAEPSQADRLLTDRLRQALALIDVRVLDHIVFGQRKEMPVRTFAERGWV